MDYVIYTFGGGEALWKVFNGLAILFKSDSGFNSVMKLSLTVGAVWATLRAMWGAHGGIFARDYFVPTYLILNLLLLPTTTVHIVDEVNPDVHYSKVDHVPLGIAAMAATASQISKLLTNILEDALTPAEAHHYGKTGPLFAARLVTLARDLRIVDPVERQNLKDFVRQCFTLPFVWTNMTPGRKAALESQDILSFITTNPHTWLGSYWRLSDGQIHFRHCQAGATRAQEVLTAETPQGLSELAGNLFGTTSDETTPVANRLTLYFGDAWQKLSHQTATAHQVAAQEMLMNTYRESVDDKRQEFGLERLNPHLILASSARAKFQQNSGFLVSAQMVGSMLPSLQSTMLAILCILFVIVMPLSVLPGGLKTLGMWVKLVLWIESWPVFYAIINSVALIMASNRGASYISTGGGLSLLTQNGLADAAYDAYCYAEGFMAIVPVLAWAVISGSGYALSNVSGTVTRSVDGLAAKLGSEITDGNLSFDNQSYHNRSLAGYQLAQQQLGSSFTYGQKYDDGQMIFTHDTQGHTVVQESQTQLKTNISGTDTLAATLSDTAQQSLQAAQSYSQMASDQRQQGLNQAANYAYQQSQSAGRTETFGHTDSAGQSQDFREAWDISQKISQQTGLSTDKVFQLGTKAGVDTGILKFMGINMGASTEARLGASERADMTKIKDTGLQNQFTESLSRGFQHSFDHKGSTATQEQRQASDSIQGFFNRAQSYQEQQHASLTESDNFNRAAALAQSQSFTRTTNWNDQALSEVANQRFGGDRYAAAKWQSDHPEAYGQAASQFMANKHQAVVEALKASAGVALSSDQIRDKFTHVYRDQVHNTTGSSEVEEVRQQARLEGVGLGALEKANTAQQMADLQESTQSALQALHQTRDHRQRQVTQEGQQLTSAYQERAERGVIKSGLLKGVQEGGQTLGDLKTTIVERSPQSHNTLAALTPSQTRPSEKSSESGGSPNPPQKIALNPFLIPTQTSSQPLGDLSSFKLTHPFGPEREGQTNLPPVSLSEGPPSSPQSQKHPTPPMNDHPRDLDSLASSDVPAPLTESPFKGLGASPPFSQKEARVAQNLDIVRKDALPVPLDDFEHARTHAKLAAQGRTLKHLKDIMEDPPPRLDLEVELPLPTTSLGDK